MKQHWHCSRKFAFFLLLATVIAIILLLDTKAFAQSSLALQSLLSSLLSLQTIKDYLHITVQNLSKEHFHCSLNSVFTVFKTNDNNNRDDNYLRKLSADNAPHVLNVHIVPHTHDDVGWRKTVEQYYYGWNESIDARGHVNDILTTVVTSLQANPARVFTYVEIKFFSMWWKEQNDTMRDLVRYLIANKQLYFVNGGWCMHDEATTHYMGMIDQTTLGHDFLLHELGVVPTVGWQLDPFGHSYTHVNLLTARAGFDALYFGRIDYQDLNLRRLTQQCEGLWNTSYGPVFWGLTGSYDGNYNAPPSFCFSVLCRNDEKLVGANETRLLERVHTFLQDVRLQSDQTQGNHIMLTMGEDFDYMNAHVNFANLDLLISSIMSYQSNYAIDIPALFGPRFDRVNVFYSTPEYYTKQKYLEQKTKAKTNTPINWQIKQDDFFPYSDCENCFWSGYYTSRANFKRFERVASAFLMAVRQLDSLIDDDDDNSDQSYAKCNDCANCPCMGSYYDLEDALGVVQHHDAVSGTAKQHVADDYSKRLQAGLNKASRLALYKLRQKLLNETATNSNDALEDLMYCQLLNETKCEVSEKATEQSDTDLYVVVYNSKASERSTVVRLPVSANATSFEVHRLDMPFIQTQPNTILPVLQSDDHKQVLMFDTGLLPPLGACLFKITQTNNHDEDCDILTDSVTASSRHTQEASLATNYNLKQQQQQSLLVDDSSVDNTADDFIYTNNIIAVTFDRSSGNIKHVSNNDVGFDISQTWGYYTSFDSHFDRSGVPAFLAGQNSGAYVFRPSYPDQKLITVEPAKDKAKFYNTSIGLEVHITYQQPWIKQVTRILQGQPYIEIEYEVGPIPHDDGRGKEIVTRFITPIANDAVFYTDSNGRQFLKRRRNHRPTWNVDVYEPVAGNYYPINAAIYLEDSRASMCIAVDRSQGGGSIFDGSLEIMVHRRTLADDARGVDEPLNETCLGITPYPDAIRLGKGIVVRGLHRILIGKGPVGASLARSVMDGIFAEPLVFVGSSSSKTSPSFKLPSFTLISNSLPPNVMLMTFRKVPNQDKLTFLIRLGHQYDENEDQVLSSEVKINLETLFKGFTIESVTETTLTANQELSQRLNKNLDWIKQSSSTFEPLISNNTITLSPMDIRTLIVVVKSK